MLNDFVTGALACDRGKARDVEIRLWLEDTLRRLPTEKDITVLLPENWQPVTAK